MNSFSVEQLEYFLLIMMRILAFVYTAPFFSQSGVPQRVKAGLSFFVSVIVFTSLPYNQPVYSGVIGYGILIIQELLVGIVMGFMANICTMILAFAGQLIDQEIGFSMVQEMNPTAGFETTITGQLLTAAVMLVLCVSNLYLYILSAIIDSFKLVQAGNVSVNPLMYKSMVKFMTDYFLIAFRIVLPVFVCILITNVILAILAKVAPQMNMFVVGMQLKVLIGIGVLVIISTLIPSITDFIYGEMKTMMRYAIDMFS